MTTDLARIDETRGGALAVNQEALSQAIEHVLATGDLAKLSPEGRVAYYLEQCRSLGLNSLSRPFDWLVLDNKLVLYPNKSCAEQLRRQHQISVKVIRREIVGDLFVCEVEGRRPNGVTDQASKYVPVAGRRQDGSTYKLSGERLANAFAKAETGAKRRLVLSMIGLSSPPDADELESARFVTVDAFGRVLDNPNEMQRALAADPQMARAIREPTFETVAGTADAPIRPEYDQRPQPHELEPQQRQSGQRPTFRCDADRWRAAYFGAVADTLLETAEGRREFLAAYTSGFAPTLQTDSLTTFLARASDRQAEDMVAVARAQAAAIRGSGERAAMEADYLEGVATLRAAGVQVQEADVSSLSDDDLRDWLDGLAEMLRDLPQPAEASA